MSAPKAPYYGPVDESAKEILLEKMFISGSFLTVFGYTLQLVLYVRCMQILWNRKPFNNFARFLMVFITVLCILSGVYTGCTAWCIPHTFVDHRNYPGGPVAFMNVEFSMEYPINAAAGFIGYFISILSDGLLVWRCRAIYAASIGHRANYVVIFPGIIYIASIGVSIYSSILNASPAYYFAPTVLHINITYIVLTMSLNVVITIMITGRLLTYKRRTEHLNEGKPVTHFASIWKMFMESAALYSFMSILLVICLAVPSPVHQLFWGLWPSSQAIADYLIIYLVASGKGHGGTADTKPSRTSALVFASKYNSGKPTIISMDDLDRDTVDGHEKV